MKTQTLRLAPEVVEALKAASIDREKNLLTLPAQLDRALYVKVAKAIETAGGKWNRSAQGFILQPGAADALGMGLETGAIVDEKKTRQAFYTPAAIAAQVITIADVKGKSVLEPSAGDGILVAACVLESASLVVAVEIEPKCEDRLKSVADHVTIGDFLEVDPANCSKFDRVVMNPPFHRRTYVKHVEHALKFLAPGGRLFAIVPANAPNHFAEIFAQTVEVFPAGAFGKSGTQVATRLIRIDA